MLKSGKEDIEAGRVVLVEIGEGLQRLGSSEVRAKVHARDERWKNVVTGSVAKYVEQDEFYLAASICTRYASVCRRTRSNERLDEIIFPIPCTTREITYRYDRPDADHDGRQHRRNDG